MKQYFSLLIILIIRTNRLEIIWLSFNFKAVYQRKKVHSLENISRKYFLRTLIANGFILRFMITIVIIYYYYYYYYYYHYHYCCHYSWLHVQQQFKYGWIYWIQAEHIMEIVTGIFNYNLKTFHNFHMFLKMITVTIIIIRGIVITIMMVTSMNPDWLLCGGLNQKSNRICIKKFSCGRCTRNEYSFYLKAFRQVNWAKTVSVNGLYYARMAIVK